MCRSTMRGPSNKSVAVVALTVSTGSLSVGYFLLRRCVNALCPKHKQDTPHLWSHLPENGFAQEVLVWSCSCATFSRLWPLQQVQSWQLTGFSPKNGPFIFFAMSKCEFPFRHPVENDVVKHPPCVLTSSRIFQFLRVGQSRYLSYRSIVLQNFAVVILDQGGRVPSDIPAMLCRALGLD